MKPKANIRPGWKMSWDQSHSYLWMFGEICRVKGWPMQEDRESGRRMKDVMDDYRRQWHCLAGLGPISAKAITHMEGYDALKKVFLAITQPSNLKAQIAMENQPRFRAIQGIKA